jgi:hypothetical protein
MEGKQYIITSESFEGEVVANYNSEGLLVSYDLSGAFLSEKQHKWLVAYLPKTTDGLRKWLSEKRNLQIVEAVLDFEAFWNKYDDKLNSSKKKTRLKWDKMTKSEQRKAYQYIDKYFALIPYGTRKKYAETYLNAELWNNNN